MSILDFISGQEGYAPRATWDYKQWTNGFGTRARHAGEVIDRDEATRRLKGEVDQARGYVTSSFGNLEAPQLDALTSFTYNLGPGWTKNGSRLSKAVAAGDWKSASSIMQEYNKAGGSVLPGLVSRRRAEGAMMLGGPTAPPGPSSETSTEPELPPMLIPGSTEFWNQNRAKKGEPDLPPVLTGSIPEPAGATSAQPQAGQPPQSLWESIMNPMTLAGLSILGSPTRDVGQGMQAGLLAQQRLDKRQDQQRELLDPMRDLERRHKEALIEKLQREAQNGPENPANVQEWQFFSKLPPEEQQRYITMKRAEKYLDTGTEFTRPNPVAPGQNITTVPKNIEEAKRRETLGKERGEVAAGLPAIEAASQRALDTVDAIRNHPGKKWGVGVTGIIPGIPGSTQKGFVTLVDQAKGQAFLEAFNSLRGGGQITEAEGRKATEALARLDRAQRPEDFDAALKDYEDVIRKGLDAARQKAGVSPSPTGQQQQRPDPLGLFGGS